MRNYTNCEALVTANRMARQLGRSPAAVRKKLEKLEIEPAATNGTVLLYPEKTIALIRPEFRKKNRTA